VCITHGWYWKLRKIVKWKETTSSQDIWYDRLIATGFLWAAQFNIQHCSIINVAISQLLTARQTSFAVRLSYRIDSAEFIIIPPPIGSAEYCVEHVCVCVCVFVCPRSYLQNYKSDLHQFFVHVTYGHGPVLLWRRIDTLCLWSYDLMALYKSVYYYYYYFYYYEFPVLWMTSYLHIS